MWIAKPIIGKLHLFANKPIRRGGDWYPADKRGEVDWGNKDEFMILYNNPFPELTFEDSPVEVELTIKK